MSGKPITTLRASFWRGLYRTRKRHSAWFKVMMARVRRLPHKKRRQGERLEIQQALRESPRPSP